MTSTAGARTTSSTSRAAATPRRSACRRCTSRTSSPPPAASGRSSRTSTSTPRHASSTSTPSGSPRTREPRTRSISSATPTRPGSPARRATFSAGFGAPFLPRHPGVYAEQLMDRLQRYDVPVWLVNTGWTGGPYGTGKRMDINHTRNMVRAALNGQLDDVPTIKDPVFGVAVPESVPGVPRELLTPRETWGDPAAYDAAAKKIAHMFHENFAAYADGVSRAVREAGPTDFLDAGEVKRSAPGEG